MHKGVTQHWREAVDRGMTEGAVLLLADVDAQRLHVAEAGEATREFAISTSDKGLNARAHSHGTPPGFHRVIERYGNHAPLGAVFESREPTGRVVPPADWRGASSEDLILTRILRLEGLEPGVNRGGDVDSCQRYIYLHGTNHEDRIGQPASAGCIRMRNMDIRDLFDLTENRDTWCWIG